jgi:hypothetical protein
MSRNLYVVLKELLPAAPLLVGTVSASDSGMLYITVPGGAVMQARGNAAVGDNVFFRNGFVESSAPALPLEVILV